MTPAKATPNIQLPKHLQLPKEGKLPPCDLWSDEPPLESDLHRDLIDQLIACLKWWWRDKTDFYVSGNLTIYFSEDHIASRDFRGPDLFVVLGTDPRPRRSWMVWAEGGKYPNLIIELLSNNTATVDRGFKKQLYQDTFRTPEYFWFHPETLEFKGFRIISGKYQPIKPNAQGWLWSRELSLFLGVDQNSLRFFSAEGELVSTPEERAKLAEKEAELAQQQVQQERQQRELAEQQLAVLKARLQELGVDPDAGNE